MLRLIWILALTLAAIWTLMAAACAELAQWLLQQSQTLGQTQPNWPEDPISLLPAWVQDLWRQVIPEAITPAINLALGQMLNDLDGIWPWVQEGLGWMSALIWTIWSLGILLLAGITAAAHLWAKQRIIPSPASAARA